MAETLTPEAVEGMVAQVKAMADDGNNEEAHMVEDGIHTLVLAAIAAGTAEDPSDCASVALTTREIKFSRWYA